MLGGQFASRRFGRSKDTADDSLAHAWQTEPAVREANDYWASQHCKTLEAGLAQRGAGGVSPIPPNGKLPTPEVARHGPVE